MRIADSDLTDYETLSRSLHELSKYSTLVHFTSTAAASSIASSRRPRQWLARKTPSSSGPQGRRTAKENSTLRSILFGTASSSGGVSSGHAASLGMSWSGHLIIEQAHTDYHGKQGYCRVKIAVSVPDSVSTEKQGIWRHDG